MINKINVRTYACVIKENSVLGLFEKFRGNTLLKFPGGGLEYGEGLIECLSREFAEELNVKIEVVEHLYTQENLIASHFRNNEQLLTIYYLANILNEENFQIRDQDIEKAEWISMKTSANPFDLPSDQLVFDKLKQKFL